MKYQIAIYNRDTKEYLGVMNAYPCTMSRPLLFSSLAVAQDMARRETEKSFDAIYEACEHHGVDNDDAG